MDNTLFEYKNDQKLYESYRDSCKLFEIKKHCVKNYYPHFHHAIEVCFIVAGSFKFIVNGVMGEAKAKEILLINSNEIHEYFESNDCHVVICIMSEECINDFHLEFNKMIFDTVLTNQKVNLEIEQLLNCEFEKQDNNYKIENKAFSNLLFAKLVRAYILKKQSVDNQLIRRMFKYIHENFKEKISLETIAEKFSYSKMTVSKFFRKNVNIDFRVFVNNVRVEAAYDMIKNEGNGGLTLLQIAMECGFDSMATFYRCCNRRYGYIPKRK